MVPSELRALTDCTEGSSRTIASCKSFRFRRFDVITNERESSTFGSCTVITGAVVDARDRVNRPLLLDKKDRKIILPAPPW